MSSYDYNNHQPRTHRKVWLWQTVTYSINVTSKKSFIIKLRYNKQINGVIKKYTTIFYLETWQPNKMQMWID